MPRGLGKSYTSPIGRVLSCRPIHRRATRIDVAGCGKSVRLTTRQVLAFRGGICGHGAGAHTWTCFHLEFFDG